MTKPSRKSTSGKVPARVITTDAEIDAAIAKANVREDSRPHIVSAQYREAGDAVVLKLATGVEVVIPRHLLQGLQNATPTELADIEIEGPGSGLHWPALDVDHYVPALLEGVFGTRQWMADLGRKGGQVRSPAKAAASRANGRRGGRPRKHPSHRAA
jgi:hypothetical protein